MPSLNKPRNQLNIDFSNSAEKARHDKLVALVENMLELQKKHHEARMEIDKEVYERQIRIVDAQIDRLVYDLYGLTEEEVKVVEEEIDKIVAELYGITDEELEEVKKTLGVLKGEDVER
jgi:Cys-tRNA synthase (O-phospho-L-seryl-tRNA:Cys-tRNA synthase)